MKTFFSTSDNVPLKVESVSVEVAEQDVPDAREVGQVVRAVARKSTTVARYVGKAAKCFAEFVHSAFTTSRSHRFGVVK